MRFLAPPTPSPDTPGGRRSIDRGRRSIQRRRLRAVPHAEPQTGNATVAALRNQPVNLYSDLLMHDMGAGLADGVCQGQAGPREFRTRAAVGTRTAVFFLHDGRASNLITAIRAHSSSGSEANIVINNYQRCVKRRNRTC